MCVTVVTIAIDGMSTFLTLSYHGVWNNIVTDIYQVDKCLSEYTEYLCVILMYCIDHVTKDNGTGIYVTEILFVCLYFRWLVNCYYYYYYYYHYCLYLAKHVNK